MSGSYNKIHRHIKRKINDNVILSMNDYWKLVRDLTDEEIIKIMENKPTTFYETHYSSEKGFHQVSY